MGGGGVAGRRTGPYIRIIHIANKYKYIHEYIHTYIHTYIHAYLHACIYIYVFWFQVLPVRGYPPWYGSHHGRQRPPTVSCWQRLHEQTSQSTLHGRSGDHARDIIQHTPCIIHHISHNSAYTTCCVDIAPGVYLCVLHPSVQNAELNRG